MDSGADDGVEIGEPSPLREGSRVRTFHRSATIHGVIAFPSRVLSAPVRRSLRVGVIAGGIALCFGFGVAADPSKPPAVPSPIGKPAPEIRIEEWVKGAPLDHFEKGRIYVVDFWATWCGPCRAAIPHLTRLAKKHPGEIEVIGISISETQETPEDREYIGRVRTFVRKMGEQMEYRVAVDRPDRFMHATWFKPAGTGGIPTAYIIDRDGRVAWVGIGSPDDVERIVEQVRSGTFDIAKETERQRQLEADALKRSEADRAAAASSHVEIDRKYPGYQAAMKRGDLAAAIASLDSAFDGHPELEASGAYQWKLMALLQRNKTNAVNAYAADLLKRFADNDDIQSFLSACIVATSEEARFDTRLALESARKAAEAAKPESRWAQFTQWRLGWAYFHRGDRANALKHLQAARDGVRRLKGRFEFDNLEAECDEALRIVQATGK